MSSEVGAGGLASLGLSTAIDWDLKRKGKYKNNIRNKVSSAVGSAWLGAVGTAVGGPALGAIMGGLGHVIGQSAEFGESTDRSEPERRRLPRPNINYDRLGRSFDYDKF